MAATSGQKSIATNIQGIESRLTFASVLRKYTMLTASSSTANCPRQARQASRVEKLYMFISVLLYMIVVSSSSMDLVMMPTCCVAILRHYAPR